MTIEPGGPAFESTWESIRKLGSGGECEFRDPNTRFSTVVTVHFNGSASGHRHGVYVVRGRNNQVVYIGKAGTVRNNGTFKNHDLPGRLKATRGTKSADQWFGQVLAQAGPLRVEYVFLRSRPCGPALAESQLLQVYLNDTGQLPEFNEAF